MSSESVQQCGEERALKSLCWSFPRLTSHCGAGPLTVAKCGSCRAGLLERPDRTCRVLEQRRQGSEGEQGLKSDPLSGGHTAPFKSNLHHRSQPSQKQETENIPRTGLSSSERAQLQYVSWGRFRETKKEQPDSRKQNSARVTGKFRGERSSVQSNRDQEGLQGGGSL